MKKRLIILSVTALLIIAGLIIYSHLREKQIKAISTTGIVEGTEVNLASKVPGLITEICCKEGDAVQKDAVAIRLKSDEIQAAVEQAAALLEQARSDERSAFSLVESAKAEIRATEAEAKNAEAEAEKARVQMEEAKSQMGRVTSLFKEALVSKADEDRAVAAFESLRASYEASKARHHAMQSRGELAASQLRYAQSRQVSAKAGVKEAEAALSLQKAKFDDTVIRAPVSGTVVFRAMEPGEIISPGLTVLTIVDMENLWVRIDIEESLTGYAAPDSEVVITVDGMPGKKFRGKIAKIGRYAEFATQRDVRHGVQDLKTFHVEIRVEDAGKILKPGMTVNVDIPVT
ncbi:MAG: HlyD family efflux transporter periplasmic adaptor subunit [Nitrospiraceae bacterium]|nr:MAG: HlyD family efflux transporter periplasmic adaptor subunit [Nitrospiraceae bacterium]